MSAEVGMDPISKIGETAGEVWQRLSARGSMSLTGLAQELRAPRDLVMQAVGWLAREGKVEITETGRTKSISLKPS